MKRNLFNYSPVLVMSVLMLTIAFASCTKKTSDLKEASLPEEFASAKSKPGTSAEVPLSLTINDASGNKITSDGLGAYVNGTGNVKVVFDIYDNFMFGAASASPRVPMTRYLNIHFNDPLPGYPTKSGDQSKFISTITTVTSPNSTHLQNLLVGQTKCIGFSAGIPTTSDAVLNFHRNPAEDTQASPTSYVYVTRNSLTEWVMTPAPPLSGGCSDISSVGSLRINTVLYGYYNMPFSFTLTKL